MRVVIRRVWMQESCGDEMSVLMHERVDYLLLQNSKQQIRVTARFRGKLLQRVMEESECKERVCGSHEECGKKESVGDIVSCLLFICYLLLMWFIDVCCVLLFSNSNCNCSNSKKSFQIQKIPSKPKTKK